MNKYDLVSIVRPTAEDSVVEVMKKFKKDIENKDFPTDDHSYDSGDSLPESLKEWKKEVKKILS